MDATQAAAEAATNGAEPVVEAGTKIATRVANAAANTGLGFMGIALSTVGVNIALTSFKAAVKSARG
jgi:hypothetical protein